MRNDFIKEREEIVQCIKNNKYYEAIDICNKVLNNIEMNDECGDYYKWQFNLKLAVIYRKLGQINKALKFSEICRFYAHEQNQYIECLWLMGNCFQAKDEKAKALKFYEKCKDYYQRNAMTDEFLRISFNIAKITNNERLLKAVIELYKINNISQASIDNAYVCLCNLYIYKKQYKDVECTLHNITDSTEVDKLRSKMKGVYTSNIL